jgi:glycosyltransferase involved in cell wall biosynthesis
VEESVFIAMVMKALFRIPFVYDMDSSLAQQIVDKYGMLRPIKGLLQRLEKVAVRASAGVVAVCKSLETTALEFDPYKLVTRLEDISLLDSKVQEGERLQKALGTNGPLVMYVGNLESYQGIDLLLESFQEAILQVAQAHLVIVGGSDGDIQRYKDKAKQLKIEARTHFLGQRPISQLAFYLDQADVLVSPRIQGQNTPMKIYSYLDSGKPLLATRLPTHTQVLDDQIALLVPADTRAMAEGLITLLKNSSFRDKLALRAKERVRQEFSRDAFERKLLCFYNTLEMSLASGA